MFDMRVERPGIEYRLLIAVVERELAIELRSPVSITITELVPKGNETAHSSIDWTQFHCHFATHWLAAR